MEVRVFSAAPNSLVITYNFAFGHLALQSSRSSATFPAKELARMGEKHFLLTASESDDCQAIKAIHYDYLSTSAVIDALDKRGDKHVMPTGRNAKKGADYDQKLLTAAQ